jgi:hypothetical protein
MNEEVGEMEKNCVACQSDGTTLLPVAWDHVVSA